MEFEVLSNKRHNLFSIIKVFARILQIVSIFIIIRYNSVIGLTILFLPIIYYTTPLSFFGKKKIGSLRFNHNCIDFVTSENQIESIKLSDVEEIKMIYYGYKGQFELFYVGFYLIDGENKLVIKTNTNTYKIYFLSEKKEDEQSIIEYIDTLISNNTKYNLEIYDSRYSSINDINITGKV